MPWLYMRPANFVIKWSSLYISRTDASGLARPWTAGRARQRIGTKWLANSHLYYRRNRIDFQSSPSNGILSLLLRQSRVATCRGKCHFRTSRSPTPRPQSVYLYHLPCRLFHPLFLVFSFHLVLRDSFISIPFESFAFRSWLKKEKWRGECFDNRWNSHEFLQIFI